MPTLFRPLANILGQAIERQRAEEKLRQSEEYYRLLIQISYDVILFLTTDGIVRFISNSCERVFGCSPAAFVSHNSLEFVHPDDVEKTKKIFAQALQTTGAAGPVELRLHHADGSWVHQEVIMTGLADLGGRPGGVLNSRDISERKRADAAQALLASIVDASEEAIASADSPGGRALFGLLACGGNWPPSAGFVDLCPRAPRREGAVYGLRPRQRGWAAL